MHSPSSSFAGVLHEEVSEPADEVLAVLEQDVIRLRCEWLEKIGQLRAQAPLVLQGLCVIFPHLGAVTLRIHREGCHVEPLIVGLQHETLPLTILDHHKPVLDDGSRGGSCCMEDHTVLFRYTQKHDQHLQSSSRQPSKNRVSLSLTTNANSKRRELASRQTSLCSVPEEPSALWQNFTTRQALFGSERNSATTSLPPMRTEAELADLEEEMLAREPKNDPAPLRSLGVLSTLPMDDGVHSDAVPLTSKDLSIETSKAPFRNFLGTRLSIRKAEPMACVIGKSLEFRMIEVTASDSKDLWCVSAW